MNLTTDSTYPFLDSYVATGFEQVLRVLVLLTVVILIFTTNITIAAVLYHSTTLDYNIKCLIGLLCCSDIQVGIIFCSTAIVSYRWFGSIICYALSMMTSTLPIPQLYHKYTTNIPQSTTQMLQINTKVYYCTYHKNETFTTKYNALSHSVVLYTNNSTTNCSTLLQNVIFYYTIVLITTNCNIIYCEI